MYDAGQDSSPNHNLSGIIAGQEEDTLSLQSKLLQMQIHLDRIKAGTAYEEAERRDIIYTRNRELQLMFIRADRYQPKEAAERMVRWFDLKKSLFGSFKLCKSISLDDLNDDDMECMRSGYMQLPPYRDVAGRVIAVGMMKLRKMRSKENVVSRQSPLIKVRASTSLTTTFALLGLVSSQLLHIHGSDGIRGGPKTWDGLRVLLA